MYTPPMAPRLKTIPLPIVPTPAVMREGYPTPPGTPPHEFQPSLFPTYNHVAPDTHYSAYPSAGPQHNVHAYYGHHAPVVNGNALGLYFPNGSPSLTPEGYHPESYSQPAAPVPQTSPEHPYSISPADEYWRLHFDPNSRSTYAPAPTTPSQSASSSSSSHPMVHGARYEDAPVVPLFPSSSYDSFYEVPRDDVYGTAASSHGSSRKYRQEEGHSGDEDDDPRNSRRKRVRWADNNHPSRASR